MKKLLSLPPNLVECFHDITGLDRSEWFCTNDPIGKKLGSGGGTTWLMTQCYDVHGGGKTFDEWLASDRRLILHAGGQSRRLPAYAPSGKILTPIPVFRWERGQCLNQDLLALQVPLYERIMAEAPASLNTMIVSGDVYIRATKPLGRVPEADVVCYGLWLDAEIAMNHGVFVSTKKNPSVLKCMLQKPSAEKLAEVMQEGYYLTDIGIWLLSDRAMRLLMRKSRKGDDISNYDLYTDFGCALGSAPTMPDDDVSQLSVAIMPLPGGEFYHYGTTHEILSSTLRIQNIVNDQREIMHHSRKPHPAMFIQNSEVTIRIHSHNQNLWIENSHIGEGWGISHENVITGVPQNDWQISLRPGQCVDVVPCGEEAYIIRPYGYNDSFRGNIASDTTEFLGVPFPEWAKKHGVDMEEIVGREDLQSAKIFPVMTDIAVAGRVLRWMLDEGGDAEGLAIWRQSRRCSADDISNYANLRRLTAQREGLRARNMAAIARNHKHSVFFQSDLGYIAGQMARHGIEMPEAIGEDNELIKRIQDSMFRSELRRAKGLDGSTEAAEAFKLLREGITAPLISDRQRPRMSVYADQIVWGRSPVRIDIAGGWTDTPPYCLMEGGDVINLAIELNGQPPLQAYIKPCSEHVIILRSIDLGAHERITTYEQLEDFNKVGSPFSIPKAALSLVGFLPRFSEESYPSLEDQLKDFGCGIEITMLSAIPAGSGLGTSSILASTVLGALNDFCGLSWDKNEIGRRTLALEQLLTTGGGWQDQFGGLLRGVKLLHTEKGFDQDPLVKWLPGDLFTQPEYASCHLLYYTGITRTAKKLLAEIVRRMFLNNHEELAMLRQMKEHTNQLYETILRGDFGGMGRAIRRTWLQNQAMDSGTNPDGVRELAEMVDDLCLGNKLPGAGGGGFLYMVAKDPEAAVRIKQVLNANRRNKNARFVDMTLSEKGLQVSRS